jgi:hypothetical protein
MSMAGMLQGSRIAGIQLLITFITEPVVIATVLKGGMVIVVVPVFE